ncbi:hypothetical protein K402DRAFT_102728 [Aulographum hederae CBS 113979]|uniref:Uncharacterized protein n=1 Tax=Aulographum hederae CBS 113979 TaxID=1176131 RepID=A0A6G1GYS2_9PEZI|nr:hypothetical protein K402DRAFT_102728 [Aulographum hederae CBS 113979]
MSCLRCGKKEIIGLVKCHSIPFVFASSFGCSGGLLTIIIIPISVLATVPFLHLLTCSYLGHSMMHSPVPSHVGPQVPCLCASSPRVI